MHVHLLEWIFTLAVTIAVLLFDVFVMARGSGGTDDAPVRARPVGLHRAGGVLRDLDVVFSRPPVRRPVLRRLAHRVQPVGRQLVHLRHHHGQLRSAQDLSARGAVHRHRDRADLPRHLHRARRGGDPAIHLGVLHLRRVPGLHRRAAGARIHPQRRQRERRGPVRAQPPERHGQLAWPQALRQRRRPAVDHADGSGRHRPGRHRPGLRAGLHPGDLRADVGGVSGVGRQRLCADGSAAAVLHRRGSAAAAGLPVQGSRGDLGVHRHQADPARDARQRPAIHQRRQAH